MFNQQAESLDEGQTAIGTDLLHLLSRRIRHAGQFQASQAGQG